MKEFIHSSPTERKLPPTSKLGRGSQMRCYFHLVNGYDTILDDDSIEVLDFESAKDQALTTINELKRLLGEESED